MVRKRIRRDPPDPMQKSGLSELSDLFDSYESPGCDDKNVPEVIEDILIPEVTSKNHGRV